MIGKVIGALFGAEMERQRGGKGVKGAAAGLVTGALIRRLGPLGLVAGSAYVAKKVLDRRRDARRGTGREAPTAA